MKKLLWLLIFLTTLVWADCDTIYLASDAWDLYTVGTTEHQNESECNYGNYSGERDNYWGFAIPSAIYNNTIDSVKLSIYQTYKNWWGSGQKLRIYGLQEENSAELEGRNVSAITRTSASVELAQWDAVGQWTTEKFTTVFQEWIDDYSHSGTDYFSIVIDDNSLSNEYARAYDYSNGSYSNHTYLIVYYTLASTGQIIIISQ